MFDQWRGWARRVKREIYALALAYRDPRVPWHARMVAAGVVAYAFSPLDLIPDPIPVLGYLDDLLLLPLGVLLAIRLIPPAILDEKRDQAEALLARGRPTNWTAAAVIIAIWLLLAALAVVMLMRLVPLDA